MVIISWTCILRRFWNPLLSHLLSNVINFCLLFIFNSSSIHIVLGKMNKFSTNETSSGSVSCPHVMFNTIHLNVSKFSTIMTSAPSVSSNQIQLLQYVLMGSISQFLILRICAHASYICDICLQIQVFLCIHQLYGHVDCNYKIFH